MYLPMTALEITKQKDTSDEYHIRQFVTATAMVRTQRADWIYVTQYATGSCLFRHPDDEEQTALLMVWPKPDDVDTSQNVRIYLVTDIQPVHVKGAQPNERTA